MGIKKNTIATEQVIVQRRVEVDLEGMRAHLKEMKPFRVVQEIISNSFDEDSAKEILCKIEQIGKGKVRITIDDDGDGFADFTDAYTMYKHSYKRSDTSKRGRFNLGEKYFFILAEQGLIMTSNKQVEFTEDKRTITDIDYQKHVHVEGVFKWTGEQVREILKGLHKLIVPEGKKLYINDVQVREMELVRVIEDVALYTMIENPEDKVMRREKKTTSVALYKLNSEEHPWLYELGIPVQGLRNNMLWHVDVRQKVPLKADRSTVSESYLQDLYGMIINNAHDMISEEDAGSKFVQIGMEQATKETAKDLLTKQFGTDQLYIPSSTDYHANEAVINSGGQLLPAGMLDRETREHLKDLDMLESSTERFGSTQAEFCKHTKQTEKMKWYADVVKHVAGDVLEELIAVDFVESDASLSAWYGSSTLTYNVKILGRDYFDDFTEQGVGLLVHELAHHRVGITDGIAHLSGDFVHEMQRISGIIGHRGIKHWVGSN